MLMGYSQPGSVVTLGKEDQVVPGMKSRASQRQSLCFQSLEPSPHSPNLNFVARILCGSDDQLGLGVDRLVCRGP